MTFSVTEHIWCFLHFFSLFAGGCLFIVGSVFLVSPTSDGLNGGDANEAPSWLTLYVSNLIIGWCYTVGSIGFFSADALEQWWMLTQVVLPPAPLPLIPIVDGDDDSNPRHDDDGGVSRGRGGGDADDDDDDTSSHATAQERRRMLFYYNQQNNANISNSGRRQILSGDIQEEEEGDEAREPLLLSHNNNGEEEGSGSVPRHYQQQQQQYHRGASHSTSPPLIGSGAGLIRGGNPHHHHNHRGGGGGGGGGSRANSGLNPSAAAAAVASQPPSPVSKGPTATTAVTVISVYTQPTNADADNDEGKERAGVVNKTKEGDVDAANGDRGQVLGSLNGDEAGSGAATINISDGLAATATVANKGGANESSPSPLPNDSAAAGVSSAKKGEPGTSGLQQQQRQQYYSQPQRPQPQQRHVAYAGENTEEDTFNTFYSSEIDRKNRRNRRDHHENAPLTREELIRRHIIEERAAIISMRMNILLSMVGSITYIIGSVAFIPQIGQTYASPAFATKMGNWGFIVGSAFILASQCWKILRSLTTRDSAVDPSRMEDCHLAVNYPFLNQICRVFCDVGACVGGLSFLIGTILYADTPLESVASTDGLFIWIFGSAAFTLGSVCVFIRHYAFGVI